ncbi:hypothetical protein [Clostridium sp.]|uniref:hypothetical protein n=1 Tax=Clostridium sp. TaxID=1506 RepID=UPI00291062F0|nr:hypothetical protein [Clostridium sp.]MDU5107775.1 hypothetical protein [Clostridium sp.]
MYIIVEDDDYDNAIKQIFGPMQKKYDEVFENIVEKIRNTSEINDYILGRGGSDYLLVSNAEYGETKYTIHKIEKSEDLNEDDYLF